MRHLKSLFWGSLLLFCIGLISCNDEEKPGPSLDYYGDGYINQSAIVDTSSVLKFKFRALPGNDTLGYVRITNADSTYWDAYVPSLCKTNYIGLATFKAPKKVGEYSFLFTMYNANPDSVANAKLLISKTISIKTDTAISLKKEYTGKLYHVMATSGNGSFDLVASQPRFKADNDSAKDMTQSSIQTAGSSWIAGWQINSSNVTKFVKLNTFNYATPTLRSAKAAFDAGIALSFVPSAAVNDIFIAKLRGREEYAIIKITAINASDVSGTTDQSKGSISFSYKKRF